MWRGEEDEDTGRKVKKFSSREVSQLQTRRERECVHEGVSLSR